MVWFKVLEAGWTHDGNPAKPHALLHSGKHSDGFFLCKKVLMWPNLRTILANTLVQMLRKRFFEEIDGVFGAPYSSITLAAEVGRILKIPNYVPEKDPKDPAGKKMIFKPDCVIPAGAKLLRVEELITTNDSAKATEDAIIAGNPLPVELLPFVCTVVHRPPVMVDKYGDVEVIAIINRQVSAWNPEDCPLCKAGSVAISAKGENWAKLTA
jgi:orotate phosphoribosyltransferase